MKPAALGGHEDSRAAPDEAILEHVPKKLLDCFDKDMLHLFELSYVLIDQMIPFDRGAL